MNNEQNAKNMLDAFAAEDYMRQALKLAKRAAALGEVPVGAVIVRHGQIIASAHNQKEQLQDPTAHAEMLAIRQAAQKLKNWRLSDCHLYVTLQPCPMCFSAIEQARAQTLIYAALDPNSTDSSLQIKLHQNAPINPQLQIIRGILESESKQLLQEFFQRKR